VCSVSSGEGIPGAAEWSIADTDPSPTERPRAGVSRPRSTKRSSTSCSWSLLRSSHRRLCVRPFRPLAAAHERAGPGYRSSREGRERIGGSGTGSCSGSGTGTGGSGRGSGSGTGRGSGTGGISGGGGGGGGEGDGVGGGGGGACGGVGAGGGGSGEVGAAGAGGAGGGAGCGDGEGSGAGVRGAGSSGAVVPTEPGSRSERGFGAASGALGHLDRGLSEERTGSAGAECKAGLRPGWGRGAGAGAVRGSPGRVGRSWP
jgi:hypothetical protein